MSEHCPERHARRRYQAPSGGCGKCCCNPTRILGAEAALDQLVLDLGPAFAAAQLYLGASLATQVGMINAAVSQQGESTTALASTAAGIVRLYGRGARPTPEPGNAPPPPKPKTAVEMVNEAQTAASAAVSEAERTAVAHGF
jgi:hypothetical protein